MVWAWNIPATARTMNTTVMANNTADTGGTHHTTLPVDRQVTMAMGAVKGNRHNTFEKTLFGS